MKRAANAAIASSVGFAMLCLVGCSTTHHVTETTTTREYDAPDTRGECCTLWSAVAYSFHPHLPWLGMPPATGYYQAVLSWVRFPAHSSSAASGNRVGSLSRSGV